MNRQARYEELVRQRKSHVFPDQLLNPSVIQGGIYDSDQLGPWTRWQGDLNADVVIIGQDWGNDPYFVGNKGVDDEREQTCTNLRSMTLAAGWELGSPKNPNPQRLFLTNAVLGIRAGKGKSGTPPSIWIYDSLPFLTGILDIIRPRAVVSLGVAAMRATRMAFLGCGRDPQFPLSNPLRRMHQLNPIQLDNKPAWFPFYHCGPKGLLNRSRELQLQDWKRLGAWLKETKA